ncbi:hypothetical protein ACFZCP_38685 [Streptomyces sp. NPDC007971]|uniref:hypothetical protein n=1 Tax=Streptomyces sp. NPDC007971 TaxID=3364799 RepID=UPI0036EC1452
MSEKLPSTEETGLVLIPAEKTTPEEQATLSVYHQDGAPVLVITNGTHLPARLTVTNATGATVATYTVDPPTGKRLKPIVVDIVAEINVAVDSM